MNISTTLRVTSEFYEIGYKEVKKVSKDYQGNMDYFVKQLDQAGVPKEFLNIRDYYGCTEEGLQDLVDHTIELWNLQKEVIQ